MQNLKQSMFSSNDSNEAAKKAENLICHNCGKAEHSRGNGNCARPIYLTKKRHHSTNKDLQSQIIGNES